MKRIATFAERYHRREPFSRKKPFILSVGKHAPTNTLEGPKPRRVRYLPFSDAWYLKRTKKIKMAVYKRHISTRDCFNKTYTFSSNFFISLLEYPLLHLALHRLSGLDIWVWSTCSIPCTFKLIQFSSSHPFLFQEMASLKFRKRSSFIFKSFFFSQHYGFLRHIF